MDETTISNLSKRNNQQTTAKAGGVSNIKFLGENEKYIYISAGNQASSSKPYIA